VFDNPIDAGVAQRQILRNNPTKHAGLAAVIEIVAATIGVSVMALQLPLLCIPMEGELTDAMIHHRTGSGSLYRA